MARRDDAEGAATLGYLAERIPPADLTAWCTGCGHHAPIPLVTALRRFGREMLIAAVRARCTVCDGRADVRPDYHENEGMGLSARASRGAGDSGWSEAGAAD